MKIFFYSVLMFCVSATAHVPALLLPLNGTPITSYFIGQSDISRAVYSELTRVDDFLVIHFNVKYGQEKTLVQILNPVCESIPQYERFQPSAFVLKGDIAWKRQGESNRQYINRLRYFAKATISSNFPPGSRPQFFEEFGKQNYWVGGEWRGRLRPGLYSIVVFDPATNKGNFVLGLNEKESWTPDLFRYAAEVGAQVAAGICNPKGFSGKLEL